LNGYTPILISIYHRLIRIPFVAHHPVRPFINHFYQSDLEFLLKLLIPHTAPILLFLNLVCYPVDRLETRYEFGWDDGLRVGFFDEDEDGEEGYCFGGGV